MQLGWLALAILSTVGYHIVLKLTPAAASPFLSLAVSYATATAVFVLLYALMPGATPLREAVRVLDWTAVGLAASVVLLDLGFLLLYRSGFDISLGQLITQSAAALLLLLVGVAYFREKLSAANIGGIALCVIGLWLINRR